MKGYLVTFMLVMSWACTSADVLQVPSEEYPSIQSAIDAAEDYDLVVVDPNTYYENINFAGKAITVRSTDPDDPNVVAATIINGSMPIDPNYGSVVTFSSGEGNNSVLEGFTVTGGTGTWLVIAWDLHEPYWNLCGGGVVCYNMSGPVIRKNVFSDNNAGEGGGVYVYGDPVNINSPSDPPIHIKPIISNNTFIDNSAIKIHGYNPPNNDYTFAEHGDGGAIVCFQGVDAEISNNLIKNNHADYYGGGIHLRQWSNGFIANNDIIENDSTLGSGIHLTYNSCPDITGNLIQANTGPGGGGGIYLYYYSNALIENNYITQNVSLYGGGIGIYWMSEPVIRNNFVVKNMGLGISCNTSGAPVIYHNTISDNGGEHSAGGIKCTQGSTAIIEHNIISTNQDGFGICKGTEAGSPVIRYNNVWGNGAGDYDLLIGDQTGINGNIGVNPEFVSGDDYHLSVSSYCINRGDPNYISEPNETDYYGNPRVLCGYTDIGANEALPVWNITTGGQYGNIQQAIDDANDYDVIVLAPTRYTGEGNRDIDFGGKAVTVQGSNPNDFDVIADTIIDSQGSIKTPHRGFNLHSNEDANSIINGLTITGGSGAFEGGGIKCKSSSPTIKNCIIRNNLTKNHGGGIYCGYGSNAIITNCLITENSFDDYGYGGGIYCYNASCPTITNCIITKNRATGRARHGGGICCWGSSSTTGSNAVVANCIVSGNSAGQRGGGLYAYWSSPSFVNCTVIGNLAEQGGGVGAFRESNPKVINCIVRDNIAMFGDQLGLINTLGIWGVNIPTSMTISHSNIQGGQGQAYVQIDCNLIWQAGNINMDPNFVDPGYWNDPNAFSQDPNEGFFDLGDYHLLPTSACVDAGDNAMLPEVSTIDIDDEERIFNGIVDMGADEVITNEADFDTDGIVGISDLLVLVGEWLDAGEQLQSDLFDDDFINFADFAELSAQWLWEGKWYTVP